MTVSTLGFYKVYVAAAAQTVFAYDFKILAAADLRVYDDGTLQVLGVDYTVSGAGVANGGNVTFVVGRTVGHTIMLRRETPRTQATNLTAAEMYSEANVMAMADKLTMILQEVGGALLPLAPGSYYLRIKADGSGYEAVAAITSAVAMPFDTGVGPPASGVYADGFVRFNSAPVVGGNLGWISIRGAWYECGFISANPV